MSDMTGTGSAVERLAQAVLDGRVHLHTEWWEDRDGIRHRRTEVLVTDDD